MASGAASLLDAPSRSVVASAADWLTGVIGGSLATTLCVIAVAMLGLLMMAGQMPIRRGLKVVLGCFLLLGAPAIASALQGVARTGGAASARVTIQPPPTSDSPSPVADRYRRASSRTN